MEHFFVSPENVGEDEVFIKGGDVNHIKNVLRMKPGDELLVSDGTGNDFVCVIGEIEKEADRIRCQITDNGIVIKEPATRFFLFQALTKSDKFEFIIQKAVELGVHEIIPVRTARCVVRYDEKRQKNKALRWRKISESAAKQSRRGIIPEVKDIVSFEEALTYAKQLDAVLIPYENFKDMKYTRETLASINSGSDVGIFIGPEGGFEPDEVEAAVSAGARQISLGSRILRTETAPLMILSILGFMYSDND